MINNRKKHNRVKKLKNDGKQIAGLEQAVHNLKGSVHEPRGNKNSGAGQRSAFKNLPNLLTNTEFQEAAWLMAVTDPKNYAAPIPSSQVTGVVPTDLFRKTFESLLTTSASASNGAVAVVMVDNWYDAAGDNYHGILDVDGNTVTCGCVTDGTYTGSGPGGVTVPASGAVLPTGVSALSAGNVSPDITTGPETGTEYIMVGCEATLSASMVAAAAADARYSGRVYAFYSLDPESAPLQGYNTSQLLAEAQKDGSLIFAREYIITEDGMFVPVDAVDATPSPEVTTVSLPLTRAAYEWQRVGEHPGVTSTFTPVAAPIAFIVMAPAGSQFQLEVTYLWQTERFASHKVNVGEAYLDHDTGVEGYLPGTAGGYLGSGMTYEQFHASPELLVIPGRNGMAHTATSTVAPGSAKRKKKAPMLHRGTISPAVLSLGAAVAPHPGKKIHPVIAPISVLSSMSHQPGMQYTMASHPEALQGFLRPDVIKEAVKAGASAVQNAHQKKTPFWKKLLSGAWDVAKIVGPALAALI